VAQYFGLAGKEARAVAREVGQAVAGWRQGAGDLAIAKAEIDRMSSAFEHEDLELARSF
jgi:serine/threonine-protein kinase HipA